MKRACLFVKRQLWKLVWGICIVIARGPYFYGRRVVWSIVMAYFLLPTRHKEIARANFAAAFPQLSRKKIDNLVRLSFLNFGRQTHLFLMLSGDNWFARRRRRAIDGGIRGEEIVTGVLERALKRGVGVIFVTFHLGFWEWAAIKMLEFLKIRCPSMRFSVLAFFDQAREEINIFAKVRRLLGMDVIQVSPLSPRTIIRELSRGNSIGMVVDQFFGTGKKQGKQVELFGKTANLPDSHFRLAQRTGAEIVVALCLWEGHQYVLSIEDVIRVEKGQSPEQDEAFVQAAAQKEARILERRTWEKPYLWFCMTDMFELLNNSH